MDVVLDTSGIVAIIRAAFCRGGSRRHRDKGMMMQTYTEAENLAVLLERADQEGTVYIRRVEGRLHLLQPRILRSISPVLADSSPLDIPGVNTDLTREEIIEFIHEGRGNDRW